MSKQDVNSLWAMFEDCQNAHRLMGIDEDTDKAYRFFEGEQWHGLESGNEQMPVYNFIAPVVKYKTAMIAMNNVAINYSAPLSSGYMQKVCASLSKLAAGKWENLKMDSKCWEVVRSAMISGDAYVYFYNGHGDCQVIDRTDIFFADESVQDISKQSYIFIRERLSVDDVKATALDNGVSKDLINSIVADDTDEIGNNKCTGVLMLQLKDGNLHYTRFTKTVVYQPEQVINGLNCYPVASFVCVSKRGTGRGIGEVTPMIPNQIEVNRNLARRILNAKLTAYSRLVYSNDRITNPKSLTEIGTAIEVDGGGVSSIKDAVTYLTPASMSPDAKVLSDELLTVSKELAGAGDAALGHTDPTKASGAAIIAVRDQAALPLNEQTARFKQFVEDIAKIWYRLWAVYNTNDITLPNGEVVESEILLRLEPDIRVDISNTSPFSKYAREQALEHIFSMGYITFNEYVDALDDDSSVPKAKLEQIIKNRGGNVNGNSENQ